MSKKSALIIGNTEYTDSGLAQLTAPGKDAEDFARVLKSPELSAFDDVKILLNESESVVSEAIEEFFTSKRPDDLLLLYFSGHGVRDENGILYLAVKNTNRNRLKSTAIKSDFIREAMDESRSKRQLLILDCCNSGAFSRGTKGVIGGSIGTASAFRGTGYGRVVLTASDATQFAWEGNKIIGKTENSLFTHFLVKGLESGEADLDGDGRITIDELYNYAYDQIVNQTPKQTPGKWSYKQQGEIVLREGVPVKKIESALPAEGTASNNRRPRSIIWLAAGLTITILAAFGIFALRAWGNNNGTPTSLSQSNQPNTVIIPTLTPTLEFKSPVDTIKIVSSLPMKGVNTVLTQPIVDAINLRLEKSNYLACSGKYKIEYESWDDSSAGTGNWDPAIETENAEKAADHKSIVIYIGPFNTGAAKLSIPILNQAGPLVMISFTTSPTTTKPGVETTTDFEQYYPSGIRNFTHLYPTDDMQGSGAADFMFYQLKTRSVYILDDQSSYGVYVADTFERTAKNLGMTVLGRESIDPKAPDYIDLITKIAQSNNSRAPDGIFFGGLIDSNVAQLLKDKVSIIGNNNEVKFVGADGILSQLFIDAAGADSAEGVYATYPGLSLEHLPPNGQQFILEYETKYGPLANELPGYGYEAASVAMAAIEKVCASGGDPKDRRQILDAVFSTQDFDGVFGEWSFGPNGDSSLTTVSIYQVQGGAFKAIGTSR